MADLTNKYIYETYKGLIKTEDNEPIDGNLKPLSDGEGNPLPIEVSDTEVNITGQTTVPNLYIAGYGEVINAQGYFVGEGGGGGGTGTSGTSGTSGVTGSSGTSGTSGTNGSSGTSGRNGYNGLNGTSGTSGIDGSGTSGTSGTSGIGLPGPIGAPGTSGTSGTSGIGSAGTSGTSGTDGVGGIAISDTTTSSSVTGTLTETIVDTIFVPANTISDNQVFLLNVRTNGIKPVAANTTYRFYINSNGTSIGGTNLVTSGIIATGPGTGLSVFKYLYVNKADGTGNGTAYLNVSTANETTAPALPAQYLTAAIDWTQDQYIVITATLANVANTAWVAGSSFNNIAGGVGNNPWDISDLDASIGIRLPINPYGVINIGTPTTSPYQPDNAQDSIAIGYYGACFNNAIYIGHFGQALDNAIVIGHGSYGKASGASVIGNNSAIGEAGDNSIAFGGNNNICPDDVTPSQSTVVLGSDYTTVGERIIAVGSGGSISGDDVTVIGQGANDGIENVLIGKNTQNFQGNQNVLIGKGASVFTANNAVAIGNGAVVTANNSVALGNGVTVGVQDTLATLLIQSAMTVNKNFVNDAAAAAAGIPVGGFYHTEGTLKIRIA